SSGSCVSGDTDRRDSREDPRGPGHQPPDRLFAVGINCDGDRDVLGLWTSTGGDGAKHWMNVLTELRNRGVADLLICCCDGLKGLPEAIAEVWPLATVQDCVVHPVCSSRRYASKKHWGPITKALRTIYTAPTIEA